MSGNVIPIGDEQSKAIAEASKAIAEALKALHGIAGFLKETFGTVPKISPRKPWPLCLTSLLWVISCHAA